MNRAVSKTVVWVTPAPRVRIPPPPPSQCPNASSVCRRERSLLAELLAALGDGRSTLVRQRDVSGTSAERGLFRVAHDHPETRRRTQAGTRSQPRRARGGRAVTARAWRAASAASCTRRRNRSRHARRALLRRGSWARCLRNVPAAGCQLFVAAACNPSRHRRGSALGERSALADGQGRARWLREAELGRSGDVGGWR